MHLLIVDGSLSDGAASGPGANSFARHAADKENRDRGDGMDWGGQFAKVKSGAHRHLRHQGGGGGLSQEQVLIRTYATLCVIQALNCHLPHASEALYSPVSCQGQQVQSIPENRKRATALAEQMGSPPACDVVGGLSVI